MLAQRIKSTLVKFKQRPSFPYWLLAAITLLAAVLRFYRLGQWSFWIDEIYTINHALQHFGTIEQILENIPPVRNWMPVSVLLAAQALNILGISEWSARISAAVIGIVSIPILFFPTRRIFGTQVALIALLLLAVSPWHIFWSQNARFYTSLFLFYNLALIAFYFGIHRNRIYYFLLFYVFLYLAFSERLFAFFIVPVIVGYLILLWILKFDLPQGLNLRNLLLLGAPIIAAGLIELFSWIAYGESRFFADFSWFFLYRTDDPIRLLGNIGFNIGIPLIVLAFFSGVLLLRKKSHAGLLMFANAVIPTVILFAVNPYIFTKDRYVFFVLFSWVVLAAYGIYELWKSSNGVPKLFSVAVLMILLFDAGSDILLYNKGNNGNRLEWKTAFNIIQENGEQDDAVVAYWPEIGPYYLNREVIAYEDIDVATILGSGKRYWFILDSETIWANGKVKAWLEKNARLIDIRYLRTPDEFFLRIYLFDPKYPTSP
jgi:4-amino-4-deoxy-L-arabinose transferase-like glycosyltransferase